MRSLGVVVWCVVRVCEGRRGQHCNALKGHNWSTSFALLRSLQLTPPPHTSTHACLAISNDRSCEPLQPTPPQAAHWRPRHVPRPGLHIKEQSSTRQPTTSKQGRAGGKQGGAWCW